MRERKRLIILIDGEREWVEDLIAALQMQCEEIKIDCESDGLSLTVNIREEDDTHTYTMPEININMATPVISNLISNSMQMDQAMRNVREIIDRIRNKNKKEDSPRDIEDVLTEAEMEEIRRSPRQIRFRKRGGKK